MPTSRRKFLRGIVGGAAVSVSLPFLDVFLNSNGTALASNAPLPRRFGTWFWGLGFNPNLAIGPEIGANYRLLEEAQALKPHQSDINFFTGFKVVTDGLPNEPHYTGWTALRTGTVPKRFAEIPAPTIDVLISDAIGATNRFKSLEVGAVNSTSISARGTGNANPCEASPLAFYTRLFGEGFIDPNAAEFKPDSRVLIRQSVLSGVKEDANRFFKNLGSADKARMDEYFTSIRQIEKQLELQTRKPPPADACSIPPKPDAAEPSTEVGAAIANHKIMAQLLAMAVACNQTKVFTMVFSPPLSVLRRPGEPDTHHQITHEEPVDVKVGYQKKHSFYVRKNMEALATFIETFKGIREGAGTLLDNTLIMAHTDTNNAKTHALDGIPILTVGKAGGSFKTGLHIAGRGETVSAVGLTIQQALGLPAQSWGTQSMAAARPVSEVLA